MRLIVVGSGVVGAGCAYAAAAAGADVVLADSGEAGRATAAGAGIVCPWTSRVDDPVWQGFAGAAARQYPSLIGELAELGETDVGYRAVGALWLAAGPGEQELARQRLAALRADAPEIGDVHCLDGAQARALFPPLRDGASAVYIGGGRHSASCRGRTSGRSTRCVRCLQTRAAPGTDTCPGPLSCGLTAACQIVAGLSSTGPPGPSRPSLPGGSRWHRGVGLCVLPFP